MLPELVSPAQVLAMLAILLIGALTARLATFFDLIMAVILIAPQINIFTIALFVLSALLAVLAA